MSIRRQPRVQRIGDEALLFEIGAAIEVATSRAIARWVEAIDRAAIPGVVDLVPSYTTLLVELDSSVSDVDTIQDAVETLWQGADAGASADGRLVPIPVRYGGEDGPDLDDVARHAGLAPADVVRIHAERDYTVGALGFAPGFTYLIGLDRRLHTPRRGTPRTRVPAGSVGIGGEQTGMYALATPGGWNLIGRATTALFDPGADDPFPIRPGDRIRYVPTDDPLPAIPPVGDADALNGPVEVVVPGLQTTVQDSGRRGYGRFGISRNGAVDVGSLIVANRAVGNLDGAAALEITLAGPTLRFSRRMTVALSGAPTDARLNGLAAPRGRAIEVMPGDELAVGSVRPGGGARAYLAMAGGISVPEVFGSRATDLTAGFGGYAGRALCEGDRLPVGRERGTPRPVHAPLPDVASPFRVVQTTTPGAIGPEVWDRLLSSDFTVGPDADRMGLRLVGPPLVPRTADIISQGIVTGDIQVTADGVPIVMLPGHATIGGYTRIATVVGSDRDRLGQLAPGMTMRFTCRCKTS